MEKGPQKQEKTENSEILALPFPHSRVKEIIKVNLKEGTFIKKKAAIELNLWLGKMAEMIAKEISETQKAYVDAEDIKNATVKFDAIEDLEKEKKRIIAHLNAIKEDVSRLMDELDRI